MRNPQFLRHAAVYSLGTLVTNACGIFLLPLYLNSLPQSEYGTWDFLRTLGDIVLIVLLFGGLKQAMLTYHGQARSTSERRRAIGAGILLAATVVVFGAATAFLAGPELAGALSFKRAYLLEWTVLVMLLEAMTSVLMTSCQARLESALFVSITAGQFFLRVGLSIAFVAWLHWGIWGLLAANGLTSGSAMLLLLIRELLLGDLWPDRQMLRGMVRFALPFVPGGLGFLLLHNGDRFFLMKYADAAALGLYALGYKLAFSVSQFSRSPLYMVWNTQMHQAAFQEDAPDVFGRAFSRILAAYLAVGLGLCLLADEVTRLLSSNYAGAAPIIPIVVLAYYCLTAADLMDSGFYVSRRTVWKTPITLSSTAVMLVLYWLLIPDYGITGAALATLAGFTFHALLTWYVTQRVFPVRYEWRRTGAALALAIATWFLSRLIPAGPWAIPLKVALWPLWMLTLWCIGLISPYEKQQALELSALALDWLRSRFTPAGASATPGASALPVAFHGPNEEISHRRPTVTVGYEFSRPNREMEASVSTDSDDGVSGEIRVVTGPEGV
jgi:O-antigen/teichoic acid export membrane protein